jgi:hypothetical protein
MECERPILLNRKCRPKPDRECDVSRSPAMDAAFCSAVRVTLVGSITPAF